MMEQTYRVTVEGVYFTLSGEKKNYSRAFHLKKSEVEEQLGQVGAEILAHDSPATTVTVEMAE